jgi:hypothetical protein
MMKILSVTILLLAAALIACAGGDAASDDSPWALTVFSHGGLCPDGECTLSIAVSDEGGFVYAPRFGDVEVGTIDRDLVEGLSEAAADTDFAAIRAVPFTGTCPIAFDGMENVYTFYVAGAEEVVASCEHAIDEAAEPWTSVNAVLAAVQAEVDR